MQLSPDMIYTAVDLFSYAYWYVLGLPSLGLTISSYVCWYVANIYFSYYEHHIYIYINSIWVASSQLAFLAMWAYMLAYFFIFLEFSVMYVIQDFHDNTGKSH